MAKVITLDSMPSPIKTGGGSGVDLKNLNKALDTVNAILNAPVVNTLFTRIITRFAFGGGQGNQQRPRQAGADLGKEGNKEMDTTNPDQIYEMIMNSLNQLISFGKGKMTLQELRDELSKEDGKALVTKGLELKNQLENTGGEKHGTKPEKQ